MGFCTLSRPKFILFAIFLLITAGLERSLDAQAAPPRPAVQIKWQDSSFALGSWPVDLNRDGRTDIVSMNGDGLLFSALGNGDGTFRAPVVTSIPAAPMGVGDFNGDGRADVVVTGVAVVQGNGDGTFGSVHPITGPPAPDPHEDPIFIRPPARDVLVADFDGDGRRDVAIFRWFDESSVDIYPGLGSFLFGAPASVPVDVLVRQGIVADFNGDGRRDIAVAGEGPTTVLLNNGGLSFTTTQLGRGYSSIAAGDMNRDGRADLVLTDIGSYAGNMSGGVSGSVAIMRGNGNGTFQPPVQFSTGKQTTMTVVVGDFNRDGLLDAATGNRSWLYVDQMCANVFHYSDSITLMPGRGDGTLGAPATYRLADSPGMHGPWMDGHNALKTSDFNGDGRTDLLASPGALLLNIPLGTNRAPTVDAGPDQEIDFYGYPVVQARAADADGEWIDYEWRSGDGRVFARWPLACPEDSEGTFTVVARDDRGATATDSVRVTQREHPTTFGSGDVGAVATPGSYEYNGDVYTVRGSGADIWGTADEFFWLHETHSGDFEVYARVLSVQSVDPWTKAGLMIREGTGANARHASLFATPGKGIAFQRRTTPGGTSVHTAGPVSYTAPIWLRLKRTGTTISAYHRTSTATWTLIGRQTFSSLSDRLEVGLAVSSHRDGTLATARFDTVLAGNLSGSRYTGDIGAVGVSGTWGVEGTSTILEGSGADIWGTADAFRYGMAEWTLDGTITVRVASLENTHAWAKAGVMFRDALTPGSSHVSLFVTPGKGVAMQYRRTTGGTSAQVAAIAGVAPEWLRLARSGNIFTGYASDDGVRWRRVGSVTVPLAGDLWVGLAVTSHNNSTLATARFETLELRR